MVLPQDVGARQQATELPDFSQVRGLRRLGPGRYTITSLRQRLLEEGRGCFYATKPDSDSESDSYDPTRECFNIDGEVETTDETQDAVAGGRAPVAREDPRTPGNNGQVDPPQEDKATQLAQLWELRAKLDEDRERLVELELILEQDQPGRGARRRAREVHRQIVGDGEPEQPVSRFPRAGQNIVVATMLLRNMPEPSNSQARRIRDEVQTLLQVVAAQQAESTASRRRGAATEKCDEPVRNEREVSVHEQPPLEQRGQHLFKTTPSTINGDTMQDTTSASTVVADMGMQRSAGTAPTAAGDTTVTRTELPQNYQVLACLAEQPIARRCPAHFDPLLALLSTTARPSQNCG